MKLCTPGWVLVFSAVASATATTTTASASTSFALSAFEEFAETHPLATYGPAEPDKEAWVELLKDENDQCRLRYHMTNADICPDASAPIARWDKNTNKCFAGIAPSSTFTMCGDKVKATIWWLDGKSGSTKIPAGSVELKGQNGAVGDVWYLLGIQPGCRAFYLPAEDGRKNWVAYVEEWCNVDYKQFMDTFGLSSAEFRYWTPTAMPTVTATATPSARATNSGSTRGQTRSPSTRSMTATRLRTTSSRSPTIVRSTPSVYPAGSSP